MSAELPLSPAAAAALDLNSLLIYADSGIVSRTLLSAPGLRVVLFAFAEGQELTDHTSTKRALVQVLSGTCSFLFNGTRQKLAAGALLHMPPGHLHAVKAEGGPCAILLTLHDDGGVGES